MVNNKPLQDAHCPRPAGLQPQTDSKASPGTDTFNVCRARSARSSWPLKPVCMDCLASSKKKVKSYFDYVFNLEIWSRLNGDGIHICSQTICFTPVSVENL